MIKLYYAVGMNIVKYLESSDYISGIFCSRVCYNPEVLYASAWGDLLTKVVINA